MLLKQINSRVRSVPVYSDMTPFFFLSGLSRTPPEKLSDLLENIGLFDNRLWMVSEELAITICGHSSDNCYYCLSHKKKAYAYKSSHSFLFSSTFFLIAVWEGDLAVTLESCKHPNSIHVPLAFWSASLQVYLQSTFSKRLSPRHFIEVSFLFVLLVPFLRCIRILKFISLPPPQPPNQKKLINKQKIN